MPQIGGPIAFQKPWPVAHHQRLLPPAKPAKDPKIQKLPEVTRIVSAWHPNRGRRAWSMVDSLGRLSLQLGQNIKDAN